MADILIRSMERLKEGVYTCELSVLDESTALLTIYTPIDMPQRSYKFAFLPDGHGRLGDLDALMEYFTSDSYWLNKLHKTQDGFDKETWTNKELRHLINKAPIIVPAEGGNADG